jgi:nucleotide-binding universal stress UspA family protein
MMKIMVTLDGSRFAEAVVESAAQLAREAKLAEVYLVQVLNPSDAHSIVSGAPEYEGTLREVGLEGERFTGVSSNIGGSRVVETSGEALEWMKQAAKEYLQHVGRQFDPIHPEAVVLVGEDVDEELARFARQQNVDIIALSSHGRSGLGRLIMGSHAQRMMEYGVLPVLVVRPPHLHQP